MLRTRIASHAVAQLSATTPDPTPGLGRRFIDFGVELPLSVLDLPPKEALAVVEAAIERDRQLNDPI